MSELRDFVDAWSATADDILELAVDLTADDLRRPTDCPGWTVHDVLAHLAHVESDLTGSGSPQRDGTIGPSDYTEAGVAARRSVPTADVIAEFRESVAQRRRSLIDLPADPTQLAPVSPGGVPWTWETMLRNRAVDLWVHEHDIRRAIDRPGHIDTLGARVTTLTFADGMPFVLGKRVGAPSGTTALWLIDDPLHVHVAAQVDDDGRARRIERPDEPNVTLRMSTETFTVLAAGRRSTDEATVRIEGDQMLGKRILESMTLTF